MCISLTTALIGVAVAGSAGSLAMGLTQADAMKDQATYEQRLREKQLAEEREMARLEAAQNQNALQRGFARQRSAALAAIGASGVGDHISFFQGLDQENKTRFLQDVRSNRLNLTQKEARISDEFEVAGYRGQVGRFNARMSAIGSVAQFVQDSASAYYGFSQTASPKAAGKTG